MPGSKSAAADAAPDARTAPGVGPRDLGSETAKGRTLKPLKLLSTVRVPNAENGVQ